MTITPHHDHGSSPQYHAIATDRKRLGLVDIARGIALIAMAIYHFSWDLEFFGYLADGTASHGWWKLFARIIASSFLIIVGFSLVLAHGKSIRWRSFLPRFIQISLAAAAVTGLSYIAFPNNFIFFGILHNIALSSLLGLVFLRLPLKVIAITAIAIVVLPLFFRSSLFDHPLLWWVGLSNVPPVSNDYVPILPWFGAVLIGIFMARICQNRNLLDYLRGGIQPKLLNDSLTFIGKHSLIFYLLHQPVLLTILFGVSVLFPPSLFYDKQSFIRQCETECSRTNDLLLCQNYCHCVYNGMIDKQLFSSAPATRHNKDRETTLNHLAQSCISAVSGIDQVD